MKNSRKTFYKSLDFRGSNSSKKYKFLEDEQTFNIVEQLIDNNVKQSVVKSYFKKIASFKKPDHLNEALRTCLKEQTSFDITSLLNQIKKEKINADVVYVSHEENILVLKINDFKASQKLGSQNWCISRTSSYFSIYTLKRQRGAFNTPAHQLFMYNFNKEPSDPNNMIGVTATNKAFIFAADKRDRSLSKNNGYVSFVLSLNRKEFYTADYFANHLIVSLKGNDYQAFNFFKDSLKKLNTDKLSEEMILRLSRFMEERFQSKALNRAQSRLLNKILLKYAQNNNITNDLKELVQFKAPALNKKVKL